MLVEPIMTIDWLRANHEMIHYFGLGFIQLKLNQSQRLHFYTPLLPPIVPEEDIHNHRYDFCSVIIRGILVQELFVKTEGDTHILEEESCKEGHCAQPGVPCGVQKIADLVLTHGSQYSLQHYTFHRVASNEPCTTLLTRSDYRKDLAEVIRAKDAPKVCPFSQKVEEKRLWEIVESMLR